MKTAEEIRDGLNFLIIQAETLGFFVDIRTDSKSICAGLSFGTFCYIAGSEKIRIQMEKFNWHQHKDLGSFWFRHTSWENER